MSTKTELKLLASRRAVLAAQSDLNRELLQRDVRQLRKQIEELSGIVASLRKLSGLIFGVGALATCLFRKKESKLIKIARSAVIFLPLLRVLKTYQAGGNPHTALRAAASGEAGLSSSIAA